MRGIVEGVKCVGVGKNIWKSAFVREKKMIIINIYL